MEKTRRQTGLKRFLTRMERELVRNYNTRTNATIACLKSGGGHIASVFHNANTGETFVDVMRVSGRVKDYPAVEKLIADNLRMDKVRAKAWAKLTNN